MELLEPDKNVEKVIEDVISVYGKTQGEWVGGYDVDTLIVNLRRAFNKKEQKPAEWSEEDEDMRKKAIEYITLYSDEYGDYNEIKKVLAWLKSLRNRPTKSDTWKPSEEQMDSLMRTITWLVEKGNHTNSSILADLRRELQKLM